MADRPIIFSGPMVRALLDGRKFQTRRLLKLAGRAPEYIGPRGCQDDPTCWGWETPDGYFVTVEGDEKEHALGWRNGWRDWAGAYAPGDRLWVREAWRAGRGYDGASIRDMARFSRIWFEADDANDNADAIGRRLRPSIHMPRWASRITLTVTDVRVQRLQDISEADAVAEGIKGHGGRFSGYGKAADQWMGPIDSFASLWISLNGTQSWDANPWVVALTFNVERRNIDAGGNNG